jgi:hypothetical protein
MKLKPRASCPYPSPWFPELWGGGVSRYPHFSLSLPIPNPIAFTFTSLSLIQEFNTAVYTRGKININYSHRRRKVLTSTLKINANACKFCPKNPSKVHHFQNSSLILGPWIY